MSCHTDVACYNKIATKTHHGKTDGTNLSHIECYYGYISIKFLIAVAFICRTGVLNESKSKWQHFRFSDFAFWILSSFSILQFFLWNIWKFSVFYRSRGPIWCLLATEMELKKCIESNKKSLYNPHAYNDPSEILLMISDTCSFIRCCLLYNV